MPAGGKRTGAGRPKGPQTLEKEAMRAIVRKIVARRLIPLTKAQISNALGIRYLVVRQKSTGKFLRRVGATGDTHDPDSEIIEIWEKDPSIQAYTDLLNRTIDKPADQIQEIKLTGEVNIVTILRARQARQIDEMPNKRLLDVQAG